jgi:hypothetical protein
LLSRENATGAQAREIRDFICGSWIQLRSILHLFECSAFCPGHGEPYKRQRDRCDECGNSPQPFIPQLRVNRFAPRGLSPYADDMWQFSSVKCELSVPPRKFHAAGVSVGIADRNRGVFQSKTKATHLRDAGRRRGYLSSRAQTKHADQIAVAPAANQDARDSG